MGESPTELVERLLPRDWWEIPSLVLEAESTLVRAGVLPEGERAYFRGGKAHKWDAEYQICSRLEHVMRRCGVLPEDGWQMTLRELAARCAR